MKHFQLLTRHTRVLADTVTPVGLYLRLRDRYPNCLLLESSDYHGQQNAFSYLAFDPLARFELRGGELTLTLPDETTEKETLSSPSLALERLQEFATSFDTKDTGFDFIT
ncbi:MAG TPA: hypothetical protein VK364_07340, partial [Hymenobacter sp.]|nr:hypothetical protein [Hymenobacter sp.]